MDFTENGRKFGVFVFKTWYVEYWDAFALF